MCETLSVPNFHGAGNSSFDAFEKSKPLSQSDFRTTRTTSPKYFPLMYFSNLLCERNISLWEKHFYEISRVGEVFCHGNERWWCYFFIMSFAIKKIVLIRQRTEWHVWRNSWNVEGSLGCKLLSQWWQHHQMNIIAHLHRAEWQWKVILSFARGMFDRQCLLFEQLGGVCE